MFYQVEEVLQRYCHPLSKRKHTAKSKDTAIVEFLVYHYVTKNLDLNNVLNK